MSAQDAGRTEYLSKLRHALAGLEMSGQELGAVTAAKKKDVEKGKYEEAGEKKKEVEKEREEIYREYMEEYSAHFTICHVKNQFWSFL